MTVSLRSFLATALLVSALALGAWTRFVGASWGAPCLMHMDEMGYNLHNAARTEYHRIREGWWRPDIISYGSVPVRAFVLTRTLLAGSARAEYWAAQSPDAESYLHRAYSFDPGNHRAYDWLRTARAMRHLSALSYTLAMVLYVLSARRLYGPRGGLLAAFALAGCAGAVSHAHYFTPEAFVTLGLAILVHASLRVAESDRRRDYLYASLGMTLVASTKVTSASVCAVVVFAALIRQLSEARGEFFVALANTLDRGRLWAAVVLSVILWFSLNPAALRHAEWYFSPATHFSPVQQSLAYSFGSVLPDWAIFYVGRGRFYVFRQVLSDAMGRPMEIVALAGALTSLALDRGAKRIPAVAALLALGPLGFTQLQTIRYVVPALGALGLCAAGLTARCLDEAEKPGIAWVKFLFRAEALACVLALAHGVFLSLAQTAVYRETDNRVAAAQWMGQRLREADRVLIEDHPLYSPPLGNEWGEGWATGSRRLAYDRLWARGERPEDTRESLKGARFVALNGWNDRLVAVRESWRRHPERTRFYRDVRARGAPEGFRAVARFANRPHLAGWWADERESEVLHVAFDHEPITVYERLR